MRQLPGLDLDALAGWLDAEHPGLRAGELTGEVIAGGKSNLTYRVTDETSTWAVRRPPLGHVLPTAHDMAREFRVISALSATDVPVAPAVALCTDPAVLGVTFYLMGFVDGVVLDTAELVDAVPIASATRLGEELADSLAALHAVDPARIGLSDFGRPEGYLARQVVRWHKQWLASQTRPLPIEARVVDLLTTRRPESPASAIVHGDYRLTNVIYDRGLRRIEAIVDWEMATLGDPLTDVGLLCVYHQLAGESGAIVPRMTSEAGFLTPGELTQRYARTSGRDISGLPWYIGFGYFKLAVIAEGIAARHQQGKTVGDGFDWFAEAVPGLLDSALDALDALD